MAEETKPEVSVESIVNGFDKAVSDAKVEERSQALTKALDEALGKLKELSPEQAQEAFNQLTEYATGVIRKNGKKLGEFKESMLKEAGETEHLAQLQSDFGHLQKKVTESLTKYLDKASPEFKEATKGSVEKLGSAVKSVKETFETFGKAAKEAAEKAGKDVKLPKALKEFLYEHTDMKRPFFEAVPHWMGENKLKTGAAAIAAVALAAVVFGGGKHTEKAMEEKMSREQEPDMAPARA